MKRQAVNSTNLKSVGYDPKLRLLEIEFQSGNVYQYENVPPSVYADLMSAPSLGSYFNANIRDIYNYYRLRPVRRRAS